jgi:hypothetical protein
MGVSHVRMIAIAIVLELAPGRAQVGVHFSSVSEVILGGKDEQIRNSQR